MKNSHDHMLDSMRYAMYSASPDLKAIERRIKRGRWIRIVIYSMIIGATLGFILNLF